MLIRFDSATRTFSPSITPLEAMQKVQRDMDGEFLYGAVVGTDFYSPESYPGAKPWEECPWDKYRVKKLKDIVRGKRGTCLEYTKYAHYMLDKMGVRNRTFMVLGNDGHLSHTFVVTYVGGDAYWLESAQWKNRGMHRIGHLTDVGDRMAKHYVIYEFDQDKVADKEMDGDEYVKWITKQKEVFRK
jgi:hypothetical protein